jgi:hypothetical protein
MTRHRLLAFAFALLAGCDSPAAPDAAATNLKPYFLRVHDNFFLPPPPETQFNPCPPAEEVLIVDGRFHVNSVMETTPDGAQTFKVHFNAQGFEGIGLITGDKYRIMDNDKVEVLITTTTFDLVSQQRFRLIREGSLDNLWLRLHIRQTDPDGEPEIISLDIECRG